MTEIIKKQEEQVEELAKEQGLSKEEFLAKAGEEQKPTKEKKSRKKKAAPKKEKAAPKKAAAKKPAAKVTIVTVKDLEAEFGIPAKTIRRHLRKMDENVKPRGPEMYQWNKSDANLKKIKKNLEAIIARQPALQAK